MGKLVSAYDLLLQKGPCNKTMVSANFP